jgi:CheY-like chemotaxis protein
MGTTSATDGKALPPQQPLRVLVVDDCPDMTASWEMLLSMAGHQVATASDGLEALEMVDKHDPHVILCDLMMPRLDGFGVARKLRERGKSTVLYALTAYGTDDVRQRCLEAGFDGHFTKPVDVETILKLLEDVSIQRVAFADATDQTA